jgi:hypothetical protein
MRDSRLRRWTFQIVESGGIFAARPSGGSPYSSLIVRSNLSVPGLCSDVIRSWLVRRPRWFGVDLRAVEAGFVGEDHGLDPVAKAELHQDPLHMGPDCRLLHG